MFLKTFLICIVCVFIAISCEKKPTIRVALAASLLPPMEEVAQRFEAETGHQVDLIPAASGVLSTQILSGAPYDIFLSANKTYPDALRQAQKGIEAPKLLIRGKLAFWSADPIEPETIPSFLQTHKGRIAIADTSLAPYGVASVHYLRTQGLLDTLRGQLVFGENISQTNLMIASHAVTAGFSASSALFHPSLKDHGHWQVIEGQVVPQWALLLTATSSSKSFWTYLFSPQAKKVFEKFGYVEENDRMSG